MQTVNLLSLLIGDDMLAFSTCLAMLEAIAQLQRRRLLTNIDYIAMSPSLIFLNGSLSCQLNLLVCDMQ